MKTFEELQAQISENDRRQFFLDAINEYKVSPMYKSASVAYEYYRKRNVTIRQYQKLLYTMKGEAVPDNYSANFKFANAFFPLFVKQEVSHLLGNGVTFSKEETKEKLGGEMFDNQMFRAAIAACWGGVAYEFMNRDHVDVFTALEFCPLFGEEDGALHAGIRFWQYGTDKPLRLTVYEDDGYTEYKHNKTEWTVLQEKRAYIVTTETTEAGDVTVSQGRNYPSFPIVPLWANEEQQSEFEGLREKIDGYDLISSGFANDLDDASQIFWTITNAGGMDDVSLAQFVERMKTVKAAVVDPDGGSTAEAHTIDVPYLARQAGLQELRDGLYRDAMALDTDKIANGSVTATAIQASYENLSLKCDAFEMCVTECINALLALIGVDDKPLYNRSRIVNMAEETQMVLSAAQYLDDETIIKHLPFIYPEEINDILDRKTKEEAGRYTEQEVE